MMRTFLFCLFLLTGGCANILNAPDLRNEEQCPSGNTLVARDLDVHLRNLPTSAWVETHVIETASLELLAVGIVDVSLSSETSLLFQNAIAANSQVSLQLFINYDADRNFDPEIDVALERSACDDGSLFLSSDSQATILDALSQGEGEEFRASFSAPASNQAERWEIRLTEVDTEVTRGVYRLSDIGESPVIVTIPGIVNLQTTYRIDVIESPTGTANDLNKIAHSQTQDYSGSNEVVSIEPN